MEYYTSNNDNPCAQNSFFKSEAQNVRTRKVWYLIIFFPFDHHIQISFIKEATVFLYILSRQSRKTCFPRQLFVPFQRLNCVLFSLFTFPFHICDSSVFTIFLPICVCTYLFRMHTVILPVSLPLSSLLSMSSAVPKLGSQVHCTHELNENSHDQFGWCWVLIRDNYLHLPFAKGKKCFPLFCLFLLRERSGWWWSLFTKQYFVLCTNQIRRSKLRKDKSWDRCGNMKHRAM